MEPGSLDAHEESTNESIGSADGRFSHDLYKNGVLSQLSSDYGSVHSIGYWYHGSVSNSRFLPNDTLNWQGKVEHIYDAQKNWIGRFECKA